MGANLAIGSQRIDWSKELNVLATDRNLPQTDATREGDRSANSDVLDPHCTGCSLGYRVIRCSNSWSCLSDTRQLANRPSGLSHP
jgi:hypothetical protein